jgi:hypothetical protein
MKRGYSRCYNFCTFLAKWKKGVISHLRNEKPNWPAGIGTIGDGAPCLLAASRQIRAPSVEIMRVCGNLPLNLAATNITTQGCSQQLMGEHLGSKTPRIGQFQTRKWAMPELFKATFGGLNAQLRTSVSTLRCNTNFNSKDRSSAAEAAYELTRATSGTYYK